MGMPEARAAIGGAVASAIAAGFEYEVRQGRDTGYVPGPPAFGLGPDPAGHDASRAPEVPEPLLDIRYDHAEPGVIFTWKAEYGEPPYVILLVPPHWRRDVVNKGWAVLGGYPVLEVTEHDDEGLPARVLVVVTIANYDGRMHGWRASGFAVARSVEWTPDGTARIVRASGDVLW